MLYTAQQIQTATLKTAADMVRSNIAADKRWLVRAILAIYDNQTADEQRRESTDHDNGVGFTGLDAKILSSFAKQIRRWQQNPQHGQPLSPKQFAIAQRKMPKYAIQLVRIARAKVGITRAKPTKKMSNQSQENETGQLMLV